MNFMVEVTTKRRPGRRPGWARRGAAGAAGGDDSLPLAGSDSLTGRLALAEDSESPDSEELSPARGQQNLTVSGREKAQVTSYTEITFPTIKWRVSYSRVMDSDRPWPALAVFKLKKSALPYQSH